MKAFAPRTLGKTGLQAGPLGLAASYGAPAPAFEEAFERGCNYFYLNSGMHRSGMRQAIKNLCAQGKRDEMIISLHTYARWGTLTEMALNKALKGLGLERADVLLLGWHNRAPSQRLMDRARELKRKGLVRFVGMSGHNRLLFPQMAEKGGLDLFHVRYNAVHRGAETEVFPKLLGPARPGIVTYTATRWGHLLSPKKMPPGQKTPAASDCYRFVLTNQSVDVCLCGPKNTGQMLQALQALSLGPLPPEEMDRMRQIGDHIHKTSKAFFA